MHRYSYSRLKTYIKVYEIDKTKTRFAYCNLFVYFFNKFFPEIYNRGPWTPESCRDVLFWEKTTYSVKTLLRT